MSLRKSTSHIKQRAKFRPGFEVLEGREVPAGMGVGMNLDWLEDYSPAWIFKDAFLQSRDWVSHSYNTATRQFDWHGGASVPVSVDARGWPTQLASWSNDLGQVLEQRLGTLMFGGLNGAYPGGIYRAEWEGSATLTWGHDASVVSSGDLADGRHFADIRITPTNAGVYMRIDAINPTNPIHDLHFWMPDYNGESFVGQVWRPGADFSPFHPLFVERLQPFETVRAIHWSDTITSDIVHASDRRPVDYARQNSGRFQNGIAPEYLIALANELDADLWINMPHMADDDYVRGVAELVKGTLEPNRTAYVEWSNEVWNFAPGFEATFWVRDQTLLPENAGLSHWQIIARETRRDFAIWSEVFAGEEARIVRTVGGFAAVPWITNQVAIHMNGEFDALAIAPYIGPNADMREGYTADLTVDQVFADTRTAMDFMIERAMQHRGMVEGFEEQLGRDIQLLGYEGGPHLDGRNQPYQNAFFQAGLDPRMYELTTDYLHAMAEVGFDEFTWFNFMGRAIATQWGDFAVLHRMDEEIDTAHKYRALLDYIGDAPIPPPTVSVAVADGEAREAGQDPMSFVVTRAGEDLSQELVVHYRVEGTAGTDDVELLSGR